MKSAMKPKWLVTVFSLCAALSACTEEEPQTREKALRAVKFVEVGNSNKAPEQSFGGVTRAGSLSRLSFQVSGRIRKIYVKVGDKVKSGQRIAAVDPTDISLQIQQAKANAAQAQAQSVSASAAYERVRALYENNSAAKQDLDTARAQKDSAISAVAAVQQSIRQLERQMQYASLKAPAAGTIATVVAEANEVVSPGQVIASLQVGTQLEVAVEVPESVISQIAKGNAVKVYLGAISTALSGTVSEIGVPLQGSTVFPITVLLPADPKLRAGLAAEVTFALEQSSLPPGAVTVPGTAVGEDRQGRFVYIIVNPSQGKATLRRVAVTIGDLQGGDIVITKGLKASDKVVTAGVNRVRDGLEVLVPEFPKPSASKASALPAKSDKKAKPDKSAKANAPTKTSKSPSGKVKTP